MIEYSGKIVSQTQGEKMQKRVREKKADRRLA